MMAARQFISLLKLPSARLFYVQASSCSRAQITGSGSNYSVAKLSTSIPHLRDDTSQALNEKDPKQITLDEASKTAEELAHDAALKGLITVEGAPDITAVSVCNLSFMAR